MTKRQSEALEFIRVFWSRYRHSPSYREIALAMGIQTSRAFDIVQNLSDRGYVSVMPGKARSITLKEKTDG